MFKEIPASQRSLSRRRLLYGVGINDAPYNIEYRDPTGKKYVCPYYKVWAGMLERCFSKNRHKIRPSYSACTLEDDWKRFSNFRAWMERQNWQGKVLDKDLLGQGRKHYGPDTCLFITPALNNLLTLRNNHRGKHPIGVSETVINGCHYFVASCSFYGRQKRLGYFKTAEEAAAAYKAAKLDYIKQLAHSERDPLIKQALLNIY